METTEKAFSSTPHLSGPSSGSSSGSSPDPSPCPLPLLSVRDLRTRLLTVDALDVAAGECVAIMGPSGCGKSLILRAIADLDPNDGTVTLAGTNRAAMPAPDWRRKVGYLAAESGWWGEIAGTHFADRDAALAVLRALGLDEDAFELEIGHASTGEKQRLALARLVAGHPDVLLLDEPTASLDPETTEKVEALIRTLMDGGTAVLMVTHSPDQAARLADRLWRIDGGRLCPAPIAPAPASTPGRGVQEGEL